MENTKINLNEIQNENATLGETTFKLPIKLDCAESKNNILIELRCKQDISLTKKQEIIDNVIKECVSDGKVNELIVKPVIFKYILTYYTDFSDVVDTDNITIENYMYLYDMCINICDVYMSTSFEFFGIKTINDLINRLNLELKCIREKSYRNTVINKFAEEIINSLNSIENKAEIANIISELIQ